MEEVIITIAVIVSAAYFVHKIYHNLKSKETKCGCGCEGCKKGCKQE